MPSVAQVEAIGIFTALSLFFLMVVGSVFKFGLTVVENGAHPMYLVGALILFIIFLLVGFFMLFRTAQMLKDDQPSRKRLRPPRERADTRVDVPNPENKPSNEQGVRKGCSSPGESEDED